MKLNRLFSAVLSAALLISLCACNSILLVREDPAASASVTARPSPTLKPSETPGTSETPVSTPEGGESPEPTPSSSTQYDKEHRLDRDVPGLIDGLEMPVVGATGYTSVSLPLYASIPGSGSTATPTPTPSQPEPSLSESPAVPDSPEPDPGVTPEPDPTESAGPISTPDPEPSPDQPSAPEPEPEPSPDQPPAPEPEPEPSPDQPSEPEPEPEPSPEPPPEAEPEAEPTEAPDAPDYLAGTAAPASVKALSSYSGAITVWEPGTAFLILEESGSWWRVSRGNVTGWIEHRYCMINLPDVIPSIIYDDANAYSSRFITSGKEIPGVTGEVFYHSLVYNVRLERQEFVMPILYSAARNICATQRKALAEGNCLVIYQTFRPLKTQTDVANAVAKLAKVDPEVKAGISTSPWSIDWFIATGVSNHQRGYALDVSMVKVYGTEIRYIGSYPYLYMTDYEDYEMPTVMHELSLASVSTVSPTSSQLSPTMNEPAIALREYFLSSGFSPLASEWWHFNDLSAMQSTASNPSDGNYYITECLSTMPELAARM